LLFPSTQDFVRPLKCSAAVIVNGLCKAMGSFTVYPKKMSFRPKLVAHLPKKNDFCTSSLTRKATQIEKKL
jgi:hypothetical protein